MKQAKIYVIVGLLCLIIGFLIGFIPMSMKRTELEKQLQDCGSNLKSVYDRLEISEPYRIALIQFIGAYEAALNNNFGIANTRAVAGFERSKPLAEMGVSPWAEAATQRDKIISALAQGGSKGQSEMKLFLVSLYRGE